MYYFCILVFPWCHKQFYDVKDNVSKLWKLSIFWLVMLYVYIGIFSITFAFMLYGNEDFENYWAICTYLLPLGWFPCFALGIALYFLFRHYHPGEKKSAWIWGVITDILSVALLVGWLMYGLFPGKLVPAFVDSFVSNRFL